MRIEVLSKQLYGGLLHAVLGVVGTEHLGHFALVGRLVRLDEESTANYLHSSHPLTQPPIDPIAGAFVNGWEALHKPGFPEEMPVALAVPPEAHSSEEERDDSQDTRNFASGSR